jgi:hypothetical protein
MECAVCLRECKEPAAVLACAPKVRHRFCQECLAGWKAHNPESACCPMCRGRILQVDGMAWRILTAVDHIGEPDQDRFGPVGTALAKKWREDPSFTLNDLYQLSVSPGVAAILALLRSSDDD